MGGFSFCPPPRCLNPNHPKAILLEAQGTLKSSVPKPLCAGSLVTLHGLFPEAARWLKVESDDWVVPLIRVRGLGFRVQGPT